MAKIDLAEVRAPFIKAILWSGIIEMIAVLVGTTLFVHVTNPLLRKLSQTIENLEHALDKVKLLSGFLPICASCKKVRDDKGYWSEVESYISNHSEAEFTHGLCPECAREFYSKIESYDVVK